MWGYEGRGLRLGRPQRLRKHFGSIHWLRFKLQSMETPEALGKLWPCFSLIFPLSFPSP